MGNVGHGVVKLVFESLGQAKIDRLEVVVKGDFQVLGRLGPAG